MNQSQSLTQQMNLGLELDALDEFVRVPGLLRRWEIEQVMTKGSEYRIEEAGELSDKTQVFAVYRRKRELDADAVGLPVSLTLDDERVTVRARLLPISEGDPLMAVMVVGDRIEDAAVLGRVREHLTRFCPRPTEAAARSATPDRAGATP